MRADFIIMTKIKNLRRKIKTSILFNAVLSFYDGMEILW